jgi:hypothetical protein
MVHQTMAYGISSRTTSCSRSLSMSTHMVRMPVHCFWADIDMSIGREWTMGELRNRDFDVLHRLWWVCAKERNRLATARIELKRITAGTGEAEIKARDKTVQKTMKAILDTLAERHTAYSEAYELAKNDPTIDLLRTDGPQLDQAPAYVRIACSGN